MNLLQLPARLHRQVSLGKQGLDAIGERPGKLRSASSSRPRRSSSAHSEWAYRSASGSAATRFAAKRRRSAAPDHGPRSPAMNSSELWVSGTSPIQYAQ